MSEEDRNRGMFKTAGEPEEEDANSKVTKGLYVDSPVGDIMTSFESSLNEDKGFNPGITNQQNTRLKETGTTKHVSDSENFSNISEQDHEDIEKKYNDLDSEQNKFGRVERKTTNFEKDFHTSLIMILCIPMRIHSKTVLIILPPISNTSLLYRVIQNLLGPLALVGEVGYENGNESPHLQVDNVMNGYSVHLNEKTEEGEILNKTENFISNRTHISNTSSGGEESEMEINTSEVFFDIFEKLQTIKNYETPIMENCAKLCSKYVELESKNSSKELSALREPTKLELFTPPLNEQYSKPCVKLCSSQDFTKVSCGVFHTIGSRTIEQNWNIWVVFGQEGLLFICAISAYCNDKNSEMSEEVGGTEFFGPDLLDFNEHNCGFNNLENNVNTKRKSENNEQSLYEEKSFVSNETKNNKKVLKSYSENCAATKKQRRRGISKRSKKVAKRLRKTRKSIRQHKSCYRLVKKWWKTQSVREGSVLSTIVYNYTDKPETDNLMFPTNNQDSSRRRRQEHGQQQQSSVQRSQLESDTPGRVSDDVRDPPGQQSIYIPPGDNRLEQYRLSTFEHYPISSPTTRKSMAKSGFYFTGFFDRVKCFACARTVERWNTTDIPSDVRWHKESCPFPRGEDCGNVPIRSLFGGINIGGASAQWNSRQNEQVLEQRDPTTGAIIRVVRFPADLPERMRQTGGSFRIGLNNTVHIQNGPGTTRGRLPGVQQAPMPPNQWRMANVISSDHRRFLTNLHLNRELDRVASFARWPVGRPNVPPAALARTGFFYLGDMDRTQCFSCGGVLRNWTLEDDALDEHRSHFPACPMILGTEQRNVKVPEYPDTPDERATNFPCRFPSNPHMRNLAAREDTFDRRWPVGRTAATPAEISQAGFFFLGERDRVKCWYCNGGLQHWEYDDIPWVEHAKWFPTCQFLLQVKGQHFVYRHLSLSPHLARPIIACQDGSPLEGVNQPGRPHDIPPNVSRAQQPSPPPVIIDPQEEMRKKKERVEKEIKDSDVVKNVLAMGFSERIVRILLEEKIEANEEASSQEIYDSVAILLDDVVKKEEEVEREDQERRMNEQARSTEIAAQGAASMLFPSASSVYSAATTPMSSLGPSPGSGTYQVSLFDENEDEEAMDQDMYGSVAGPSSQETTTKQVAGNEEMTPSLREQLHKIEEERMCKVCFTNPAEMVFVPCGHICCCMQCTEAISHCPVCRVKIQRAIKTYLS